MSYRVVFLKFSNGSIVFVKIVIHKCIYPYKLKVKFKRIKLRGNRTLKHNAFNGKVISDFLIVRKIK